MRALSVAPALDPHCKITPRPNGDGHAAGEGCSVGGQACSRAIQYHEFSPDQTPWHLHEYCECN